MLFDVPQDYAKYLLDTKKEGSAYRVVDGVVKGRLGNAAWYTNLEYERRRQDLILYKRYSPDEYPRYDNYDAIEVSKTKEIPVDWDGTMGVPISFLDKYSPDQFEIVGLCWLLLKEMSAPEGMFKINGKRKYRRIVIRHRR